MAWPGAPDAWADRLAQLQIGVEYVRQQISHPRPRARLSPFGRGTGRIRTGPQASGMSLVWSRGAPPRRAKGRPAREPCRRCAYVRCAAACGTDPCVDRTLDTPPRRRGTAAGRC